MRFFFGMTLVVVCVRVAICAEDVVPDQPQPAQAPAAAAKAPEDDYTAQLRQEIREVRRLTGHTAAINRVVISVDGQRAISGSDDETVRYWNLETGELIRVLGENLGKITCVALTGDGSLALAAGENKIVYVWKTETGEEVHRLTGQEGPISKLVASRDGKWAASTSADGEIRRWDLASGEGANVLEAQPKVGSLVRPLLGPTSLIAFTDPRTLTMWDYETWQPKTQRMPIPLPVGESRIAIWGDDCLAVAMNRRIFVFSRAEVRPVGVPEPQPGERKRNVPWRLLNPLQSSLPKIEQILFQDGGRYLRVYGGEGSIESFRVPKDSPNCVPAGQFPATAQNVTCAMISPDGRKGLTGYADGSMGLWQLSSPRYTPEESRLSSVSYIWRLFNDQKFDRLEEEFVKLRADRGCFFTGDASLGTCYLVLNHPQGEQTQARWDAHFANIEKWKQAKPDSVTPRIVRADSLIKYAWVARGNGMGGTVTEEGWRLFRERLEQSKQEIEEAEKISDQDLELYRVKINLGMGEVYERDEVDEALRKGMSIDHYSWPLYEIMSTYLLPRWHGGQGELEEWAKSVADKAGERSDELYARIACSVLGYVGTTTFETHEFDLERIAAGMAKLQRGFPESQWVANNRAYFAWTAHDLDAARQALAVINERDTFYSNLWGTPQRLYLCRRWCDPKLPRGQEQQLIWAHKNAVLDLKVTADGTRVLSIGNDWQESIKLWDLKTGEQVAGMGIPNFLTRSLAVSPDNRWLSLGGRDRERKSQIQRWSLDTAQMEDVIPCEEGNDLLALAYSPDGRSLASADHGKKARVWNLDQPDKSLTLEHADRVWQVAFSPDGKQLATMDASALYLWDAETGKQLDKVACTGGWGRNLRYSPNGRLVPLFQEHDLVLYDVLAKQNQTTFSFPQSWPEAVAFSHDGKQIATADTHLLEIKVWDIAGGTELATFRGHFATIRALAFSLDDKTLISGSDDTTIRVWNLSKLRQ